MLMRENGTLLEAEPTENDQPHGEYLMRERPDLQQLRS